MPPLRGSGFKEDICGYKQVAPTGLRIYETDLGYKQSAPTGLMVQWIYTLLQTCRPYGAKNIQNGS